MARARERQQTKTRKSGETSDEAGRGGSARGMWDERQGVTGRLRVPGIMSGITTEVRTCPDCPRTDVARSASETAGVERWEEGAQA